MPFDHRARLTRAADGTGAAGLDALVVAPSPDLSYLVGYEPPPLERLTALVVRPSADPVLVVPRLERPRAEAAVGSDLVGFVDWSDGADPYEAVSNVIAGGDGGRIGVTDHLWAVHLLGLQRAMPRTEWVRGSPVVSKLRAVKDADEIEFLRAVAHAADSALQPLLDEGLEGRTERDVATSLARHLVEQGHDSVSFTIVGSGPNGASPHHEPADRVIGRGDCVVLDFGGRRRGYCSDITRTVSVGEPPPEVKEVHGIVREAQEAAFRAASVGVTGEAVDAAARAVIAEAGFGDAFIHRTGHGIGLEEHEEPYIVTGNDRPLEPGNCFSIEPGIYLEGRFGVRIEDQVALHEEGPERLNVAPHDLVVVD